MIAQSGHTATCRVYLKWLSSTHICHLSINRPINNAKMIHNNMDDASIIKRSMNIKRVPGKCSYTSYICLIGHIGTMSRMYIGRYIESNVHRQIH